MLVFPLLQGTEGTWGPVSSSLGEEAVPGSGEHLGVYVGLHRRTQTRKLTAPKDRPCWNEAHAEPRPPPHPATWPWCPGSGSAATPAQASSSQLRTLIRPGLQSARVISAGIELAFQEHQPFPSLFLAL